VPFLRFRMNRVLAGAALGTPEGRARAAEAALAVIREHPSELVRDQYLMELADVVRIEPTRLRDRMRSGGRGGAVPLVPEARRPAALGRDNPELEALRHAVHDPDEVMPFLTDVLFADERNAAALRALVGAATLHDALATTDPGAAEVLQRLAVEETDSEPLDAVARLVEEAARRELRAYEAEVRRANQAVRDLGPVKLAIEDLREPDCRREAIEQLVAWLGSRRSEGRM
jgi:DNA primase